MSSVSTGMFGLIAMAVVGSLLTACEEPQPRSFTDFMDDRIAREGTILRCDGEGEQNDIECANARRAAATVALREERERLKSLEEESERKLAALRDQMALQEQRARDARLRAAEAAKAAYDALWEEGDLAPLAGTPERPVDNGPSLDLVEVPIRRRPTE